jgi:transposase-like protein
MRKGKPRDPHKEQHWRTLLDRWQHSGLTIADFCRRHRLALASFYAWRRTLQQRDRTVNANATTHPPTVTFVPLHVCPDPHPSHAALELVFGNGRVLRIPAGCAPEAVRALLTVLEEPPC